MSEKIDMRTVRELWIALPDVDGKVSVLDLVKAFKDAGFTVVDKPMPMGGEAAMRASIDEQLLIPATKVPKRPLGLEGRLEGGQEVKVGERVEPGIYQLVHTNTDNINMEIERASHAERELADKVSNLKEVTGEALAVCANLNERILKVEERLNFALTNWDKALETLSDKVTIAVARIGRLRADITMQESRVTKQEDLHGTLSQLRHDHRDGRNDNIESEEKQDGH